MWLYFVLGALIFHALEEAIDKITVVKDKTVNLLSATIWRNFFFWFWIVIFGVLGLFGHLEFFISWPIIGLAVMFLASGLFYTYTLKKIEITGMSAFSFISPSLYLLIDVVLLRLPLTFFQVAGILLLITGGLMFAVNIKTRRLKREFTPAIWGIILFDFSIGCVEFYAFKYYFDTMRLNEVSYLFSVWGVMMIMFLIVITARNQWSIFWQTARLNNYLPKMIVSKGCDALSSYLVFHAVALATVSQVNAVYFIYPIILIGVVYVGQNIFKFKAEEKFSQGYLVIKIIAIVLLVAGGFLMK